MKREYSYLWCRNLFYLKGNNIKVVKKSERNLFHSQFFRILHTNKLLNVFIVLNT